ncbi:MAG: hypothetical protein ACPF8V_02210 [Luteibaculum sp.]
MVRKLCFLGLSLVLCLVVNRIKAQNFYLEIAYSYNLNDSVDSRVQQFAPKEAIVWGNEKIQFQRLSFGLIEILRVAHLGQDSVDHYLNLLGKKIRYRESYAAADSMQFSFTATSKSDSLGGMSFPMAIGHFKDKKFPVYYIPGYGSAFFPRFKALKGIPVQYKLSGIDPGVDALVYVKKASNKIPADFKLSPPTGHETISREEMEKMFGFFK